MENLNMVDGIKLFGFLLVVIATILSVVIIPIYDRKISRLNKEIGAFKDSRLLTGISALAYGKDFVKRRIELFERNQLIMQDGNKKLIEELAKRALDDTIKLARQWAVLLSGDQKDQFLAETNSRIDSIVKNNTMPLTEKLDAVEVIWKENQTAASKRLEEAHAKWHKNEKTIDKLEKTKSRLNKWFAVLQICGLICFSGAEVFDKLIK